MKKMLVIFMLVLLPLSFGWAAVATYCQLESGVAAEHWSHHSHDLQASDAQASAGEPIKLVDVDDDCAVCHLGCAAALSAHVNVRASVTASPLSMVDGLKRCSAHAEEPERPQWHVLA